jgi:hypothetical protein
MPTSKPEIISPVAKKILEIDPGTVIDIGVGHGKWGFLTREYTDIWKWRHYKSEWKVRIHGIEVFDKYKNPVYDYAYDKVYFGHAEHVLKHLYNYNLGIMIDVLEHFEKRDGINLISLILSKCDQAIISYSNCAQGSVRGNDHEEHLSTWSPSDFDVFACAGRQVISLYSDEITNVLHFTKRIQI